jgi:mRNA-degrading endonuclease HigB of HigAB toxin-antitoxin module
VFGSGDFAGKKVISSSRVGLKTASARMMFNTVAADRFCDAETLCRLGLIDSPATRELKTWWATSNNTKSFIGPSDLKNYYPAFDWYAGRDIATNDGIRGSNQTASGGKRTDGQRGPITDAIIPYFRQAGGRTDQFYVLYPRSDSTNNNVDRLYLMPDSTTINSRNQGAGKTVDMGQVIPTGTITDNESDNNLVFKIMGTNNRHYGVLKWDSEKNCWVAKSCYGANSVPIYVYSDRIEIGDAPDLKHVVLNNDNVNISSELKAWMTAVSADLVTAGCPAPTCTALEPTRIGSCVNTTSKVQST